ncbi:MAG: sulfurtransferase [Planctomycetes bacterium]|nr:sulfurtransferase [Planctomycetota bacterium]
MKPSLEQAGHRRAGLLAFAFCLLIGCAKAEPDALTDFPAGELPNGHDLVSVSWLKGLLDYQQSGKKTRRPATYGNERFAILEVSWATLEKAKDYHRGHIPGAIHFNTDDLENGEPRWRLREADELPQVIGRAGITPDTTVIVYSGKLIAAARVWWALKYAGVADVRLLDGGFEAWAKAGYPVEKEVRLPEPVEFLAPVASRMLATTDYVRDRLQDSDVWMADVRSEKEFTGRASGYSYLDAKGRIPSAIHLGDADDSAHLYNQRNGRLKPPAEILAHWQRQGIIPAKENGRFERELVFYCGGGWRSSVAFFYAWLLGFENIRNYSDGWSGWSTEYHADSSAQGSTPGWRQQSTGNPIETGAP